MNQQLDDENKTKLIQDDSDDIDDNQLKSDFKPNPIYLVLSIIGTLASFFCYFVLDLRMPAILLVLFIILLNYLSAKREYQHELDKAGSKALPQQSVDNDDKK